jgi:fatty-acid desaturase
MTATGMVNSVCHKWGSRARDSRGREYRADDSRNNPVVAVVTGGEGNHSWHRHADPASATGLVSGGALIPTAGLRNSTRSTRRQRRD